MSASCSVHSGASKEARELMKGGLGDAFHFPRQKYTPLKGLGVKICAFPKRGSLARVVPAARTATEKKKTNPKPEKTPKQTNKQNKPYRKLHSAG